MLRWLLIVGLATLSHPITPRSKSLFTFVLDGNVTALAPHALANAEKVPLIYPGWAVRFYAAEAAMPADLRRALLRRNAEVVPAGPGAAAGAPALWAHLADDDPTVKVHCHRELEMRPSARERAMVQDWLASGKGFHSIRDDYFEASPASPGLWCSRGGLVANVTGRSMASFLALRQSKSAAQFLHDDLLPAVEAQWLVHDAFSCDDDGRHARIPLARTGLGFVGQRHTADGRPQPLRRVPTRARSMEASCVRQAWLHLITQMFLPASPSRRRELVEALHRNLRNPVVQQVHLLGQNRTAFLEAVAGLPPPLQRKATFVPLRRQMLYADAFRYASSGAFNDSFCMVLNSDIIVGTSFLFLGPQFLEKLRPYMFALSRHPADQCLDERDQCWRYGGSHDAFLFVPPIREAGLQRLAFRQNLENAENAVMLFLRSERRMWNPCKLLHIYHFHCSRERQWQQEHGQKKQHTRVHYLTWPSDHFPWQTVTPS